ncbi:MAG: nitrate reductase [Desulfovibrionaceae bacterium]|nr:nitrate reductase [Desulfovibrionaceae bacterium]MBF0513239.1 nitrate reductase [Desulfovibrionaceae bacterium]
MDALYTLATGPLLMFSFAVFALGAAARVALFVRLARRKDLPVLQGFQPHWAARSILHWLIPANVTAKASPFVTGFGFLFHISFLACAVFCQAHVVLIDAAWSLSWWTLPDQAADLLAQAFLAAAAFFAARRLLIPVVRTLTTPADWLVLAIAVAPMLTGLLAARQIGDYNLMITLHALAGNLLLLAIPFTKLSHMILFFVSRAVTGSDFGKRQVGAW